MESELKFATQAVSETVTPVEVEPGIFLDDMSTSKPQRSPEEIQILLKYETPKQTLARITNDLQRYQHARAGKGSNNPQTCLRDPGAVVPTIHQWSN